jgi:hypothetical protein
MVRVEAVVVANVEVPVTFNNPPTLALPVMEARLAVREVIVVVARVDVPLTVKAPVTLESPVTVEELAVS